jgi:hypothetical protein
MEKTMVSYVNSITNVMNIDIFIEEFGLIKYNIFILGGDTYYVWA